MPHTAVAVCSMPILAVCTEHLSSSHPKHLSSHTYMQRVLMRVLDKLIFSSCTLLLRPYVIKRSCHTYSKEVGGRVLHLHTFSCYKRPFSTGSMVHPESVRAILYGQCFAFAETNSSRRRRFEVLALSDFYDWIYVKILTDSTVRNLF